MRDLSLIDNMKEAAETMYAGDKKQHTIYVSPKEYEAIQKREHFNQTCKAKAAEACHLLRKQLRQQELERLSRKIYSEGTTSSDFVFVQKKELLKFMDDKAKQLTDAKSQVI
jgi:phenylacetate-coenzyme A ligase PaaK-like adenylate-forming protein